MSLPATYLATDAKTRMSGNALRLSVVLLTAGIFEFVLFLREGLTHGHSFGASLTDANTLVSLLTILVSLTAVWLSRAGYHLPAGILLGSVSVISAYVIDANYAELGVTLGITTLLLFLTLANATVGGGRGWVFGSLGVLAGASLIIFDALSQTPRPLLPTANLLTYIYAGMLLIIAGLLFQSLQSSSLRTKLAFAFVLSTIVGIAFVSISSNQSIGAAVTNDTGQALHAFAQSRGEGIGNLISTQIEQLRAFGLSQTIQDRAVAANATYTGNPDSILAGLLKLDKEWRAADAANNDNDPLVRAILKDPASDDLRNYRTTFPENVEVFITDKFGASLASTNRTSDYYQADEEWWQVAYNGGKGAIFLGQPEVDASAHTFSMVMAVPLYAHNTTEVVGVLRTTLAIEFLRGALGSSGQTIGFDIVFPDNQFISAESRSEAPDLPAFVALRSSSATYLTLPYQGRPSLLSSAPVTGLFNNEESTAILNLHWLVVAYQEQAQALAPLGAAARTSLLVALLATGLAFLAAVSLAQLISQPMARLTSTVAQISGGDFSAQAPVESGDEIGSFAAAFNLMTSRLRDTVARMEQRVIERTADLRAANAVSERRVNMLQSVSEIARAVSSVQDQPTLLQNVTQLIRRHFGYSHVAIFLFDDAHENLVLRAADSDGGRRMLVQGYQVPVGDEGLVGQVASSGEARIALDVGPEALVFNYPELSTTRSQMILPLSVGQKVIGVLDLHSDQPVAFQNEDTQVLSTLANHVAIAIENSELLTTTRQALEESQRAYQVYVKREWALMADRHEQRGYRFAEAKLDVLNGEAEGPEYEAAAASGETTTSATTLAIPLKVRGEVIGVIGVHASGTSRQWSESEIALIQAAADRVALTLENARLLQEAQRLAAKERTIGEITSRISATTDMDSILQIAAQELGRTLGGSEVVIQFQDRTGE